MAMSSYIPSTRGTEAVSRALASSFKKALVSPFSFVLNITEASTTKRELIR